MIAFHQEIAEERKSAQIERNTLRGKGADNGS
jgi:hypothetical protein